jgi:hypothetical protein
VAEISILASSLEFFLMRFAIWPTIFERYACVFFDHMGKAFLAASTAKSASALSPRGT